jgi:hypothetical protein
MIARPRVSALVAAFVLLLQPLRVPACAFCSSTPSIPSVQRLLKASVHALLGQTASPTEVEVTAVLRSGGGYNLGDRIAVGEDRQLEQDAVWLVLLDAEAKPPRLVKLTPVAAEFAQGYASLAPAPEGDRQAEAARLAFFLGHIGDRDRLVASSVSNAFAEAPYEVVKALLPHLDAAQIEEWLESAMPEHRGILHLLLAIEGSPRAHAALRRLLEDPGSHARQGFDGLIGAYLLLEGEPGLEIVLESRPPESSPNGARVWFASCMLRALDFHLNSESVLLHDAVFRAVHEFLDDPYTAGPAIGMLIAQKHWLSLDRVLSVREQWAAERPSIDRATRAYLDACEDPRAAAVLRELDR